MISISDRVRVIEGKHKGKSGFVTAVGTGPLECEVEFDRSTRLERSAWIGINKVKKIRIEV